MFEKNIPYHIISHAVEGKKIFISEEDNLRFVFQSHAANIGHPAFNLQRQDVKKAAYAILNGEEVPKGFIVGEHPPLVYPLSFAHVVNHHHDVLISNTEYGISKYLQKLHTGFAKYLNLKYGHKTTLFAKRYKIIPVRTEPQLHAVIKYINIKNPLDVYQPDWINKGLRNKGGAFNFLNNYQFSSLPDLTGKRNSKLLAPKAILEQYLIKEITGEDYDKFINDYLEEKLAPFEPFFLE
jgi:hypothetical protein